MVEAILDGRQPEGMALPGPLKGMAVDWETYGVSPLTAMTRAT